MNRYVPIFFLLLAFSQTTFGQHGTHQKMTVKKSRMVHHGMPMGPKDCSESEVWDYSMGPAGISQ